MKISIFRIYAHILICFFCYLIGFNSSAFADPLQKIKVKMTFSGDLTESYDFDGKLGDRLIGISEKPEPVCENTSTFQIVLYRDKNSLEIWLRLKCTVNGQKIEFRPGRFFIDPLIADQSLLLPSQSEKFKKISIQFSELEIKTYKSKKK